MKNNKSFDASKLRITPKRKSLIKMRCEESDKNRVEVTLLEGGVHEVAKAWG